MSIVKKGKPSKDKPSKVKSSTSKNRAGLSHDAKRRLEEAVRLVEQINKRTGAQTIITGDQLGKRLKIERVPTDIFPLDIDLGGGLPCGRMIELYGEEGSGKSTIALRLCATIQRHFMTSGLSVAYIDVEGTLDEEWATACGVDMSRVYVVVPDTAEEALDIADTLVRSGLFGAVVIDSIAALSPEDELENDMLKQHVGLQARLLSKFCRKVTAAMKRPLEDGSKNQTILLLINQIRDKVGVFTRPGMPPPVTTPGGRGPRFYSSLRIEIKRLEYIKDGNKEEVGQITKYKIVKSKVSKSRAAGQFDLYFCDCKIGDVEFTFAEIDNISPLIELSLKYDVVKRSGMYYYLPGKDGKEEKIKGRDNLVARIRSDAVLQESLKQKLIALTYKEV